MRACIGGPEPPSMREGPVVSGLSDRSRPGSTWQRQRGLMRSRPVFGCSIRSPRGSTWQRQRGLMRSRPVSGCSIRSSRCSIWQRQQGGGGALVCLRLPCLFGSGFRRAATTRRPQRYGLPPAALSVRFGVRAGSDGRVLAGAGFLPWAWRGARSLVGSGCAAWCGGASPSSRPLGQPKTGTGEGGLGVACSGVANFARHRAFAARMALIARSRSMASAIPSSSGFMASDHSVR
jgi:hypothetical protein